MEIYRLRVTLKESELVLDYRERGNENWLFAAGCAFADPDQARHEFSTMMELQPALIRDLFREWRCQLPPALQAEGTALWMGEGDFVEPDCARSA